MDEPKKCQICGAPAIVHITKVINNKATKLDLCEECAQKNGYLASSGLPFSMLASLGESLFKGIQSSTMKISKLVCETCGCSPEIFKKNGRLGCKDCYKNLSRMIDSIIANTQKSELHNGKCPVNLSNIEVTPSVSIKDKETKTNLEKLLRQAITEERFEDAAKIRDEIKNLRINQ